MEWVDLITQYDIGVAGAFLLYLLKENRRLRNEREKSLEAAVQVREDFQAYTDTQAEKWQRMVMVIREARSRYREDPDSGQTPPR